MTSTPPDLSQCCWPALAEPYQTALRQAVSFVLAGYQPVAIVAGGSLLRGQGDATSDLDIYVVHQEGWRQRVQKRFNRVAAEIFINPPQQVRRYFSEERKDGRELGCKADRKARQPDQGGNCAFDRAKGIRQS